MKFLCLGCDQVMSFSERQLPGDGTFAVVFACTKCKNEIAMLANPMETQLVSSMGVKIGGRTLEEQPMEIVRSTLADGSDTAFDTARTDIRVAWSADAQNRLSVVPSFVRGMVKRIYTDYAKEHGIAEITPAIMDRARTELGLEGM
jgi:hypothetical protein